MVCAMEANDHQRPKAKESIIEDHLCTRKRHCDRRGCCRNTIISFKRNRVQPDKKKICMKDS